MNSMLRLVGKQSRRNAAAHLAALAGLLVSATMTVPATAQNAPQDPPPFDVNNINSPPKPATPQPADAPKAVTPAAADGQPTDAAVQNAEFNQAASVVVAGPTAADGPVYEVSRFLIEWHAPHEQHPDVEELLAIRVRLGVTPQGYVTAFQVKEDGSPELDAFGRPVPRPGPTTEIVLKDVTEGGVTRFYASALRDINQAISDELNRRGLIAVFSHPAEDMIDPETGDDLRERKTGDLRLIVWTGRIAQIRTIAVGDRLAKRIEAGTLTRVDADEPVSRRIRAQSPVQNGDLVNRAMIDDFVFRLNRHPGRRVDVAVAAGVEPETVTLDYMVTQNKPWTAYAQVSNTGTPETSEWRERFGYINNQATYHDDIFSIDYVTGNFDASNSVSLNYDFPLISDKLRWRNYASWSQYNASEVGFGDEEFDGTNWMIGSELRYNLWQHRDWFIDAVGGVRWQDISVTNEFSQQEGNVDFFEPYIGADLQRFTDDSSTLVSLLFYFNADSLPSDEVDLLGRPDASEDFQVLRFQAEQSNYLEPVFNRLGWLQGKDGRGLTTLAHEVAGSVRGQWALDDSRLIPNEQEVAGGMFTVRGYPQSIAAGDNAVIASAEYRFHLPNFLAVQEKPGRLGNVDMPAWVGSDFRWAPQQAFGRADWDLVLKAFIDFGHTSQNDPQPGESSDTLLGTGLGIDIRIKRNLDLRIDWGVALKEAGPTNPGETDAQVQPGDNEWNVMFTLSY